MPLTLPPDLMVSVSGLRGRVGEALTPELMAGVAAAFGAFLQEEGRGDRVCVGRDSRTSGPMFLAAVEAGLQSVGCRVVSLGVVPTPTLMLAVEHHGAAGGVAVTASHNPAEWNALKLASGEGMFLDGELSRRFRDYLGESDPPRARWDALPTPVRDEEAVERHIEAILGLPQLDVAGLRDRAFHVALDCVRGAGGVIVPELLRRLGCRVTAMDLETDGLFPRDPEPTAQNLEPLGKLVREREAEIGFAVDPDVDRLSLVDEAGRALGEDLTLAVATAVVLRRRPGPVVTNLSTSRVVEDVSDEFGGTLVRAPVGEINVARRMQAEDAVVGGEGNGGVILPDLHLTRDAPAGVALVLQHLLDTGLSPSEAVARWPSYEIVKEKIGFPREALADAYAALEEDLGADEKDTADGLRLAWKRDAAWLHVRPSGTEPVVRIIAEAPERRAAMELIGRAREILEGVA
jgi:phosphomannomutase